MSLTTILPVIFGGLSLIFALIAVFIETKEWNKGHCKCGNEWKLYWADPYRRIYECNQCGKMTCIMSKIDKRRK